VIIDGTSKIGRHNEFFPFAIVGGKTQDLKYLGEPTFLEVGDHNVFRENCTVHRGTTAEIPTRIGSHNLFLSYAHVAHDCQLGDHIIMSNFSGLAGHVVVEDHAVMAGYVAVHQFCRVGTMSMLGGCTKVRQDVAPYMLVDGDPGETRALNKIGLERNGASAEALAALKQAHRILFREGLAVSNALARIEQELPALPEIQHLLGFVRASQRGICR
jgi:UDP-N-acetylglucosamine acyltransferase